MKDEAVKVTEEIVETAVETGNREVILVAVGVAGGVAATLVTIRVVKAVKAMKEAKNRVPGEREEVEDEE